MFTTLLVLMIIVALLLIIVVLVQNPKGGGLSGEFGGVGSQMFGVQRTNDLLEKLTWGFFTFILVGALASGIFFKQSTATSTNSELDVESAQAAPVAPAQPTLPAPGQAAPAGTPAPAATPAPAPAPANN